MAELRIDYVLIKKENKNSRVSIDNMSKLFYRQNKDYLFCPNPLCNARIEYCEGPDRIFFRTKKSRINGEQIVEQHIDGCQYGIEHKPNISPKVIYDPNIGFLISDNHVLDSMKRAFKQHENPNYGIGNKARGKKREKPASINTSNNHIILKGKGILGRTDGTQKSNREPSLFQRFTYEINDKDYGQARLVKGIATSIEFDFNSVTIMLNSEDGGSSRMHFSEDFRVNNAKQFDELRLYQQYLSHKVSVNQEMFIICAGDITRDEYDISVQVRSYKHIFIDGMTHHELCTFIYKFID